MECSFGGVAPSNLTSTLSLASGLGCVAGIAQMSKQQITRLAMDTGMDGVGMGVASALFDMTPSSSLVYGQLIGASDLYGILGY